MPPTPKETLNHRFHSSSEEHNAPPRSVRLSRGMPMPVLGISPLRPQILAIHRRFGHDEVPIPSDLWIMSHSTQAVISLPDRGPEESPIRQDQLQKIQSLAAEIDASSVSILGEQQAEQFIAAITKLRLEHTRRILKKYYSAHGHPLPDWVIDQAIEHPDKPFRRPKSSVGWRLIPILLILAWLAAKVLEAAHRH